MANSKAKAAKMGATEAEKFLVLPIIVLILAQMGTSGDNGALSIANSALVSELGATTPDIQLANMVYSLMAGALMIAGGLVGTIIGFRKNFRLGAALCAAGELVIAFSTNMTMLIWGGRVLVGFGASFMIPSVLGLVPKIYHGKNRVMAFGCIGAASGLSALLPLILGIIMQLAGFRTTYIVLACYFVFVLVMSLKIPAVSKSTEKLHFDGIGTGLAALGLFLLLIGLSRISAWGLITPFASCPFTVFGISPALPLTVLGIIVLVVMVKVEKNVEAKYGVALLPQSFLKSKQVLAGLCASGITFFFMGIQSILLSPYLQLVSGWTPILMGAMSLAVGIPTFLVAMGIPKFMPNANPRRVIALGYIVMAASMFVMLFSLNPDGSVSIGMPIGFVVAGIGIGIMSSHQNNVVALALNERDAAQSGGIQTTMRNVGQALGVALLGSVLLFGVTGNVAKGVMNDANISPAVMQAVSEKSITLMSDDSFLQTISGIDMTDAEQQELLAINSRARITATQTAFVVGAAIILLALFTTPWITKLSKSDSSKRGSSSDEIADKTAAGAGDGTKD